MACGISKCFSTSFGSQHPRKCACSSSRPTPDCVRAGSENDQRRTSKYYILANPPFNISDWGGERLREDPRWKYGIPPAGNANFGWLQHILHHLGPNGTAGVVLANGSMSSSQSGEGDIRKAMIEGGVVDCMIAMPGQLFYSTQIPACLWFLAKNTAATG